MFDQKNMGRAIANLCAIYGNAHCFDEFRDEDEYENGFDADEIVSDGCLFGFSLHDICQGLAARITRPPQFKAFNEEYMTFKYQGPDLFDQNAILIVSELDTADFGLCDSSIEHEVWLLEDGSLVNVEYVSVTASDGDETMDIGYRRIVGYLETDADLIVSGDKLLQEMSDICEEQMDGDATVYAL